MIQGESIKQPKGAKVYAESIYFTRPTFGYNFSLDYKIFPTLKSLRQYEADHFEDPVEDGFAHFSALDDVYIGTKDNIAHHDLGHISFVVNAPNWIIAHEATHAMFEVARQFTPYKLRMIAKVGSSREYEEDFCTLMEMFNFVPQNVMANARKYFRSKRIKFENEKSRSFREYENNWK